MEFPFAGVPLPRRVDPVTARALDRHPLAWLLAATGLVKAAILYLSGPIFVPDSGHYVRYAATILDHAGAFEPVSWGAEPAPYLIFRPPGYPLFLAGAMLISRTGYAVVAVIGQSIIAGLAISLIFIVARRLLRSNRAALVAAALYAGSIALLWDDAVISDSLFASLWNIVVFTLLGALLDCWRLTVGRALGLGLLWGCAVWVRDVGIYFTALPVLLLLLLAARDRRLAWRGARSLAAFVIVVAVMAGGIAALNQHRTGEPVFSITGVENWLQPLLEMARRGYAQPFDGDDLISTTVRETLPDYSFDKQLALVAELHRRCRCTPTQLQAIEFAKYRQAVARFPLAYARVVVKNLNYFALGELVADPVATLNQFFELGLARPESRFPGLSLRNLSTLRGDFNAVTLAMMLTSAIGELVSAIAFTVFVFGTLYLLARAIADRIFATEEIVVGFFWVSFVGVSFAFSLVHIEARYVLPVLPAAAIGLVFAWRRLFPLSRRGREPAADPK